jgi:hypothetical protein
MKAVCASLDRWLAEHNIGQFMSSAAPAPRIQVVFPSDGMAHEARMAFDRSQSAMEAMHAFAEQPSGYISHRRAFAGIEFEFVGPHIMVKR